MVENSPYFSILMPVYNAAGTLQRSLDSIEEQGFRDFEVVAVDDCSTDGSPEILAEYAQGRDYVKVVRHGVNSGAAAARNTALDNALGKYLVWLDADDSMAPEELQTIYENGDDAEIIGWDWTLEMSVNGRYMRQADYVTPLEALKKLMGGVMRWNLWLWSVKRELWGSLRFEPEANMGEDMMALLSLMGRASTVSQIHKALYNYNGVNSSSISKQFGEKNRSQIERNLRRLEENLKGTLSPDCLGDSLSYLKLYLKLPLLQSTNSEDYRIWYNWMAESNPYAVKNPLLPPHTKAQQWMAAHKFHFGLKLYYILIYRFIYGIVYR